MKVLIVGHLGNMGRRYAAICDYLGVEWDGYEPDDEWNDSASHVIIASPTSSHLRCIEDVIDEVGDCAILCEKPITKWHPELNEILALLDDRDFSSHFFMVNNYAHIHQVRQDALRGWRTQDTHYSFYNTGGDGVYWDCIQLIHLAKREIKIDNKAPVWDCKINGVVINRAQVDRGYIDMIKDFIGPQNNLWGYKDIIEAHAKVEAFAKTNSLYCEHVPLLVGEASQSSSADQ